MFNQTIARLDGKESGDGKAIGFLWHEAIQGRTDDDITSVVIKFLITFPYRNYKHNHIIIWCDNCPGQNKNWTLFSALVHLLCHPLYSCVLSITLRFFEKGHTFMSADSAHHNNENATRRKRLLFDFQDFVDCGNDKGAAILMHTEDFIDFQNGKGSAKDVHCTLIADISDAQFRRNVTKIFWKSSFTDQDNKESEFLPCSLPSKRWSKGNKC